MWDKIKQIVSPLAPVLGGMIGGPAGAAVVVLLKQTLLGNKDASDEQLLQAVQGITPEQQLILKQADYNYQVSIAQIAARNQQVDAADRNSARNRQIELGKSGYNDYISSILAIGFMIIYAIVQLYAIHNPGSQDDIIAARVQDAMMIILTFHFGSSWSSRKKDSFIEGMKK